MHRNHRIIAVLIIAACMMGIFGDRRLDAEGISKSDIVNALTALTNVTQAASLYPVEGNVQLDVTVFLLKTTDAKPSTPTSPASPASPRAGARELGSTELPMKYGEEVSSTTKNTDPKTGETCELKFKAKLLGQDKPELYHVQFEVGVVYGASGASAKGAPAATTGNFETSLSTNVRIAAGKEQETEQRNGNQIVLIRYKVKPLK